MIIIPSPYNATNAHELCLAINKSNSHPSNLNLPLNTGAYAGGGEGGGRGGGVREGTPKKAYLTKIEEKKKEKNHKIKKIYQNYHNAVYKWLKSEDF